MDNSAASQLPKVDSLPDGFVESSAEVLAPQTPTFEQEKPSSDHKEDSVYTIEPEHASMGLSEATEAKSGKAQKIRTFPVLLSEEDSFNALGQSAEVLSDGSREEKDASSIPESANAIPVAPLVVDGGQSSRPSNGKEQAQVKYETAKKSFTGGVDLEATHIQDISASDRTESLRNRKQEVSEVKRKNPKCSIKPEEFLEVTLKYQQVIAERDSATAVRDKLESLCRELQRQNKVLMAECKRVSTEGQNMRLDLSTRFYDVIKDVSNRLDEQKDECLSQFKENEMLKSKLKELADQYALSEQEFTQKLKQKSLELQLGELKIQQHEQKMVQEQSQMKLYAEQVSQLLATEKNLRLQLAADGEKFQQFQDALSKSNEVFGTFKQEIEKMTKSIKELKKKNVFLKSKCEKTDVTLVRLVEEREHLKNQVEKTKSQKDKLESLCRSLQAERNQNSIRSESSLHFPT